MSTKKNPLYFSIGKMGVTEMRDYAEELENVLEALHDGVFITDGNGNILMVNSAWERICGITRNFIVGKNAQTMVDEGFWSESAAISALKTMKESTILLNMTKGDKLGQRIMATGTPILDEAGNVKRVVVNVRDISEIVNLKEQLEQMRRLNVKYAAQLEHIRFQQVSFGDVIARSPGTRKALEMAAQVAKVDSTVLIIGESGVGKEVVANMIHRLSNRAAKPQIKINCGAIPENLLESELFGYEPGAFTGARKQGKPGMFELADNGTLFLDEIGDLSLNLQVKLLRVLEERKVIRVGGIKAIPVDTRIVAATNKDLRKMVVSGKFRDDLYYRLNVVSIEIPPLRERREDIPLLSLKILEKINKRYNFNKRLSSDVIEMFSVYPWPGNIRELENVIERMVVMTNENEIQIRHVPVTIREQPMSPKTNMVFFKQIPLKLAIEQVEKQMIEQALKTYGSTRRAAEALEISQTSVVRKAKKLKILIKT